MVNKIVWLAGDWTAPLWAGPQTWIESRASCRSLPQLPTGDNQNTPAAVVWAQSRPGEVGSEQLASLPLGDRSIPILVLAGPWCEGELRSGTPLPSAVRIEWNRWQAGLAVELEPFLLLESTSSLPRGTLSPEAQLIARTLRSVKQTTAVGEATICTDRLPLYESLAAALKQFRIRAVQPRPHAAFTTSQLVLYDGWPQVTQWTSAAAPQPLPRLLLLNWPRPADVDRAAHLGIPQVVALPFRMSELASALSSLPLTRQP